MTDEKIYRISLTGDLGSGKSTVGEIIAERHILSIGAFENFKVQFGLSEAADLYIGLRHPADMTSDEDFVALRKANIESVEP